MRTTVLLILTIVMAGCASALFAEQSRSPEAAFYRANTLYEEGSYDRAIDEYSALLAQGVESGNLYYNLGNAYFKKGDLGRALLNYERAKKLIPRDSDLQSNYKYARAQTVQSPPVRTGLLKKGMNALNLFTMDEHTLVLSGIYLLICVLAAVAVFFVHVRKYVITTCVVLALLSIPFAVSLWEQASAYDHEGVVVVEKARAGFEPAESATVHFTLHEGTKVFIVEVKKEWIKVRRDDGKVGWIRAEELEKL